MESPGKLLQTERKRQRLSLNEVSRSTRIKEPFLAALEEDRYDLCPSPFYVRAFIISYARHLGLNPDEIVPYRPERIPPPPVPEPPLKPTGRKLRFRPPVPGKSFHRNLVFSVLLLSSFLSLYFLLNSMTSEPSFFSRNPVKTPPTSTEAVPDGEKVPIIQKIKPMDLIGPQEVQAEPVYKVLEATLGTGIDAEGGRLAVVGRRSDFQCENQRVYFFTKVMASRDGKVFHVWRLNGEEVHRIEMPVKLPFWSVYSYITLYPARSGNWNVEVWAENRMLEEMSFKAI
jgi:transcriptional regulator with XRE-family HTH domain